MTDRKLLTPYPFQDLVINRADQFDYYGYFLSMGLGKSLITVNNIRRKYVKHGGILKTLIFCPVIVLRNWKKELMLSTHIPEKYIGVIEGRTAKHKLKIINDPDKYIIIINYESVRNLEIRRRLAEMCFNIVVCDESHKIKNPNTTTKKTRDKKKNPDAFQGTFKEVYAISRFSMYRYILTGTPITNDALDLFSQFMFLDRGKTFGTNFYVFRNKYFIDLNARWSGEKSYSNWQFNETLIDEFQAKIDRISTRMLKEDVAKDLPPLIKQVYDVGMSPEQAKHYKEAKQELITWLEGQEDNPLIVKNALTKALRLNEITSGYMKLADGSVHKFKDNLKLDGLMELIDSLGGKKCIIFAVFSQNYVDIIERLEKKKIKYVEVTGRITKTSDKLDNVDKFNNDPTIQVCLANPESAGLGINLKVAGWSFYYSRDFKLTSYLQSRDRNHRLGVEKFHDKILHYHLLIKDTLDEKVYRRLLEKESGASAILDVNRLTISDIKGLL